MENLTLNQVINNNLINKTLLYLEYHKYLHDHASIINKRLVDLKKDKKLLEQSLCIMHRCKIYKIHLNHNGVYYTLFKQLESLLLNISLNKQSRNKNKLIFNNCWNINLGRLINAQGASGFEMQHNIYKGKGVSECIIKKKWKSIWHLCKDILNLFDNEYGRDEDYAVAINCMNSHEHFVKFHVDSSDITHQYCLALGNYKNGETEIIINGNSHVIDYYYRIVKMDGRNKHRVLPCKNIDESFVRFGVIWYKLYDRTKFQVDPIYKGCDFVV